MESDLSMSAYETYQNISTAVKATVLALVALLVIGLIGVFGFGWFQRSTADYRGKTGQIEQVQGDGSYRIAAYDHFYDLCAAVQAQEASIGNVQAELDTKPDKQRTAVLEASLTALKNNRAQLVTQYNADARKADTKGHFRSSDLPFQINLESEHTTCSAS